MLLVLAIFHIYWSIACCLYQK